MVEREDMAKMSWCIDNHITIYPVTTSEMYTVTKMVNGRRKKTSIPKCVVEVNIDGYKTKGTELWEQDEELSKYIHKLYNYYYERKNN